MKLGGRHDGIDILFPYQIHQRRTLRLNHPCRFAESHCWEDIIRSCLLPNPPEVFCLIPEDVYRTECSFPLTPRIKRKATSPEKPEEKSEILAVDNNLKTGAVFYFDNDIALSTVNLMLMAIRRSQIGYYSMPFPSEGVSRANTTPSMLSQFIEGLLDVYHTYITTPYNVLKEEQYFYLKGYNFVVMFTHNKRGKCICLGSFPSDLLTHLKQEDIRYVRMRDEDEDELAEFAWIL